MVMSRFLHSMFFSSDGEQSIKKKRLRKWRIGVHRNNILISDRNRNLPKLKKSDRNCTDQYTCRAQRYDCMVVMLLDKVSLMLYCCNIK